MCANFANKALDQFVMDFAKNDAAEKKRARNPVGLGSGSKGADTRANLLGTGNTRKVFAGGSNEGNLGFKSLLGG